jgi:hypothetical protein
MHETILNSGWDSILLGAPFIALLFCGFFRLDQVFASKGHTEHRTRRAFSGVSENGEPFVCDPDGRSAR